MTGQDSFSSCSALSPDGSEVAICNVDSEHYISVYATADGRLLRKMGPRGQEPGEFPGYIVPTYHPISGNLLLAEKFGGHIHELRASGEFVRLLGDTHAYAIRGIASNGALVAISKDVSHGDHITVIDYVSGCPLRTFAPFGHGAGRLSYTQGCALRFSADGTCVVTASSESSVWRASIFDVSGAHVRDIPTGPSWVHDVVVTWGGVLAVSTNTGLDTYALATGKKLQTLQVGGNKNGSPIHPMSLMTGMGGELWVLDSATNIQLLE